MPVRRGAERASVPKKRGRGRPRKNVHGRKEVSVGLPPDLLAELDRYVVTLREEAPGASRGDVLSEALRAFRPFRLWGLTLPEIKLAAEPQPKYSSLQVDIFMRTELSPPLFQLFNPSQRKDLGLSK